MTFDEAFKLTVGHEGGFDDNPDDRGNWTGGKVGVGELRGTKYGVSAAAYPMEDIKNLDLGRAMALFYRDYWGPAGCDFVPDGMKFDLFDTAVNSGVDRAVRLLQKAAGAFADGVIGPKTLMAIGVMDPERLQARFNGHRLDFLNDNLQLWSKFGRGWAQRIAENLMRA